MKQKTLILLLTAIAICLLGLIAILKIIRHINIDRCLDNGGEWNYQFNNCDCNSENTVELKPKIEIIQVYFGPSKHYPATITYNLSNNSIILQKSTFTTEIAPPPELHSNYIYVHSFLPNTSYFKIDSANITFLHDSIITNLSPRDFESNVNNNVIDGIGIQLIFFFNNDSIVETTLINERTINQDKLLTELIGVCLKNDKDTTNQRYLETLLEYL